MSRKKPKATTLDEIGVRFDRCVSHVKTRNAQIRSGKLKRKRGKGPLRTVSDPTKACAKRFHKTYGKKFVAVAARGRKRATAERRARGMKWSRKLHREVPIGTRVGKSGKVISLTEYRQRRAPPTRQAKRGRSEPARDYLQPSDLDVSGYPKGYEENLKAIRSRGRTMPSDTPYGRMVRGIMEEVGAIPPRRLARTNPTRTTADPTAARELTLYAWNDGDLYRRHRSLIERSLDKRVQKGTYDHAKALKAWESFARFAAEKYMREYSGPGRIHYVFNAATRRLAAESFRKAYEDERNVRKNPSIRVQLTAAETRVWHTHGNREFQLGMVHTLDQVHRVMSVPIIIANARGEVVASRGVRDWKFW